jgi:hypothetical protein
MGSGVFNVGFRPGDVHWLRDGVPAAHQTFYRKGQWAHEALRTDSDPSSRGEKPCSVCADFHGARHARRRGNRPGTLPLQRAS